MSYDSCVPILLYRPTFKDGDEKRDGVAQYHEGDASPDEAKDFAIRRENASVKEETG